jgi:hypothetical protein
MESEDPLDSVSGTLGLTGCVDTIAILARTGKGTTLYIRGRDVEEQEKAVVFNKSNCRWTIMGDAEEVHRSDTRQAILTILNDISLVTEPLGPKDIALQTYVPENRVNQRLIGMVRDGEIIKVSRGGYISALPVPDLVRELVIAHTKPGLHKVYDQHAYIDEKRHALELWAKRLRDIISPPPGNVVGLRTAR